MKLPKTIKVQTLMFNRVFWTVPQARAWAKKHKFVVPKVDVTTNEIRIRQHCPKLFQPKTFRTITLMPKKDVKAVVARPWVEVEGNPHMTNKQLANKLFDVIHRDWKLHRMKHDAFARLVRAKGRKPTKVKGSTRKSKPFDRVVTEGAKAYKRNHKVKQPWNVIFPQEVREKAADLIYNQYQKYWKEGQLDQFLPKAVWSKRQEK